MPLTHDMEEAKDQNDFLADSLLRDPKAVLGPEYERLEELVMILGEVCSKKGQCEPATLEKFAVLLADISNDAALAGPFLGFCQSKLTEE